MCEKRDEKVLKLFFLVNSRQHEQHKMDLKSLNDVQKQLFQRVIQKLIARNQCTPSEIENMQKLLDNVRDTKNFHMIMEKLKDCGQIELDSFEENFKEGELKFY